MQKFIKKIIEGQDLSLEEAQDAMRMIIRGEATQAQIGSYISALRMKGESIEEITASARVLRECCARLAVRGDIMDIVGTGGDCTNTFNVSTVSSFVVAASGIRVAKHGNRSVSSKCGSADLLEALGVVLDILPEQNQRVLEEVGMCFMFAPTYHSAMKRVAGPRKELGFRTLFNILGPLSSPAYANLQVLGVYDESLVEPMAQVLSNLGLKHAMVVHGHDGVDEVSLTTSTTVCEVRGENINSFFIHPKMLGLNTCALKDLAGGDAKANKEIALDILNGKKGPKRDMVLINSALSLYTASSNSTLRQCVKLAEEIIDSGKALEKLKHFVEATQLCASLKD